MSRVLAAAAVVLFVLRVLTLMDRQSPVTDEVAHIPAGFGYVTAGSFELNPEHPPIVKLVSSLGSTLAGDRIDWRYGRDSLESFFRNDPQGRVFAGRWPVLLFSVVLLGVLYFTIRGLFDEFTAATAVIAASLLPDLIAHSVFVHTDVAASLFYLATFSVLIFWKRNRDNGRLLLLAAVVSTGLLVKFSLVLALANAAFGVVLIASNKQTLRTTACFLGAVVMLFAALSWMSYRGSSGALENAPAIVKAIPIPNYYKLGFGLVVKHNVEGHQNVFLGRTNSAGSIAYFPMLFVTKTPLPLLAGMLLGLYLLFRTRLEWRWEWLLFTATYWANAMLSNINIGVRHILPVVILMSLPLAVAVHNVRRKRVGIALLAAAGVWLIFVSGMNFGSELAYFNEFVGTGNGWKYFGDSNVDWGQELSTFAGYARDEQLDPIYESALSPIPLSYYGVSARPIADASRDGRMAPGWYVISAQTLAVRGTPIHDVFSTRQPVRAFGNALFLYRLEREGTEGY